MTTNLPKPVSPSDDLIKKIAMEVGKEVVDHIETMYPAALDAVAKTARLSIRNTVYNSIMAAVKAADEGRIEDYIRSQERLRRKLRQIRKAGSVEEVIATRDFVMSDGAEILP